MVKIQRKSLFFLAVKIEWCNFALGNIVFGHRILGEDTIRLSGDLDNQIQGRRTEKHKAYKVMNLLKKNYMKKKILMMAMAIISATTLFTSCGDDDEPELVGYNGKFVLTEELKEGNETSPAMEWLTSHIDSLNKVYASLGTDLNEAESKTREANTDLSLLLRAFNQYIATHDAGENMFYTSYRFMVNKEYPETSEEIRFLYEGGNPRVVTDTTIIVNATESFKVTDSLKKTVYLIIKELENTKSIESLDGFRVVKNDTKEFFTTQAFSDIKAKTTENILGNATHEFVLTYTIGIEDKVMIDNFYVIVPIKVTKDDKTESIIDYVVNIEIK